MDGRTRNERNSKEINLELQRRGRCGEQWSPISWRNLAHKRSLSANYINSSVYLELLNIINNKIIMHFFPQIKICCHWTENLQNIKAYFCMFVSVWQFLKKIPIFNGNLKSGFIQGKLQVVLLVYLQIHVK